MSSSDNIKRRILVVDDEPSFCEFVEMMLGLDGHAVKTVASGEEALACAERTPFDLVITDYSMPQMKGDELAQRIKRMNPALAVVMVTGYAEMLESSGTPLPGISRLLNKPFQLDTLRDVIRETCPIAA
jgi:CheY-like chemotaxis protein